MIWKSGWRTRHQYEEKMKNMGVLINDQRKNIPTLQSCIIFSKYENLTIYISFFMITYLHYVLLRRQNQKSRNPWNTVLISSWSHQEMAESMTNCIRLKVIDLISLHKKWKLIRGMRLRHGNGWSGHIHHFRHPLQVWCETIATRVLHTFSNIMISKISFPQKIFITIKIVKVNYLKHEQTNFWNFYLIKF